ncbi:MAG: RHS repeat-associated core domain-containing protein [Hyphomicrobium sp.]
MAVVHGVNTATPALYHVHVDHLHRPIKMTNAAKNTVWDASWWPFGAGLSITGPAALDLRFPGQWFQLESGLHYNWHRHYDPSLGRYTQPDPLGFVDGPGVYGYVRGSPQRWVDRDGRQVPRSKPGLGFPPIAIPGSPENRAWSKWAEFKIQQCHNWLQDFFYSRPKGYWDGPDGAEEWGRRNGVGTREARNKFHEIKSDDPGSRGDDDYYVDPASGDVVGPDGESVGNMGD